MKKKTIIVLIILICICISPVSAMQVVKCGGFSNVPAKPLIVVGKTIKIIQILVPIIIIIMGIVDFVKALISTDDAKKSVGIKMFVKRVLYGLVVFFVIAIVQFIFAILEDGTDYMSCASCIVGNDCETKTIQIGESTGREDDDEDFTGINGSTEGNTVDEIEAIQEKKKVTGIEITKRKSSMEIGETYTVKASVKPKNATNKKIIYKSSKTGVATINTSGKITAKKKGTTTITVQSSDNKSKKKTFKLTVEDSKTSKRKEVIAYAKNFVGNPYVLGGNSLTHGIDCSGFTKEIYKHFGYTLPRTSEKQRSAGKKVASLAKAEPGDLICYDGHVALYMGNNKIIHASNPKDGIKVSSPPNYRPILAIRRIIY